jgi:DNA-binding CsgD family transcriptional regulator/tetratricopeptide (TPR) repeat protein
MQPQPNPSGESSGLRLARVPFVGRDEELAGLAERLAGARQGAGGIVLIAGEPGIGKTRLVSELAERARATGWRVLTGRAYQAEGLPPFLPFVEALRGHIEVTPPETLRGQLGMGAADVALLVPELGATFPELVLTARQAGEAERFRLFESVTDFLLASARTPPPGLLLILDDLHWADVSSLNLLLHLSRRLASQPVLILGTYREMELERGHPLHGVLAELVRERVSDRIVLRGLTQDEVARFIELTADVSPPPELAHAVYRQTEGNPLFVVELVRLLAAEGRLREEGAGPWRLTIPESVHQVIGRRLDRLSADCNAALTLAAVIGREFSLLALEAAGELQGDALLDALEEAEAARVVAVVSDAPGRYAFTHPLIRETLYSQVLTSRRVRLHRRVGVALERLYAADPEPHLAELAHHFFQAAPGGDVAKAIGYARRAGDRAMSLVAYEEAARLYDSALQALTLREPDEAARCELLLSLGEAQTRAGETAAARETFERTAHLAESLGLATLQARAALGYGGYRGQPGLVDTAFVALAEKALASLGGTEDGRDAGTLSTTDQALRARLLARLAMELYFAFDYDRCAALSGEAVATARRTGDTATLAAALVGRHYATHTPDNLAERLAITAELIGLAEAAGDREVALQGYYLRVIDALEAGDIAAVDGALAAHGRLAAEVRQPLYGWRTDLDRAMQATLEGRFGEGLGLAQRAFAVASRAQLANALPAYGVQMLLLALLTGGDLAALEPGWRGFAERFPRMPSYRAGLMVLLLAQGREEEAREQFEIAAAAGFTDIPRDDNMLPALSCLAEVCRYLGDAPRAAVLYELSRPYADRVVVVNSATGCRGAFAMYVGLLAATLGRWDAAEAHFADALAIDERLRARPYVVLTHLHRAETLLRRDRPGDAARAEALLRQVRVSARELGMTPALEWATRLIEAGRASAPTGRVPLAFPDGLTGREVDVLRLLAAGRTNREIAGELVLSTRTVDHHIASIYRKINARRRADAAAYAQRMGLVVRAGG